MAYLLIAIAFAIWVFFACLAVLAARLAPGLYHFYPYAWRTALFATIGILAANCLWGLVVVLCSPSMSHLHIAFFSEHNDAQLLFGVVAMAGVAIASVLGWLSGMILGLVLAYRHSRLPPNNSFEPKPLRGSA